MLLIWHLIFAFASLGLMLVALAGKAIKKRDYDHLARWSGVSFAGLLATGVALVIDYHAPLMSACLSGLFYLAAMAGLYAVYRKLAIYK